MIFMKDFNTVSLKTDLLIIGGGTAGCYAAITASRLGLSDILICEKANIKRSGCLAAGVNALNAYITKGHTPQYYVDYCRKDADGIVRGDLLLTMSERLNKVTADLEKMGLVILKDENGDYVTRGTRNIKINGENIKPILAKAATDSKGVRILNRTNIVSLIKKDEKICGAFGFNTEKEEFYKISAKAVIIATGGASGLYRPNNPGFSRHKMWYSPFNTGAGYAMGFLAGAEMTTFEMRFVALRCKDTIAPTGTLAQGVGAKQINSKGEVYEYKYGLTTSQRVYGTVNENRMGRGPCYLRTSGISKEQESSLKKAYLNMAPSQTLKWIESGKGPSEADVEIEGTEPYVVGGHTASGFWVHTDRQTTIHGLFAAGDVAGGSPQKYVTGALAEGEIAAESAVKFIKNNETILPKDEDFEKDISRFEKYFENTDSRFSCDDLEEAMQTTMETYAGGISKNYGYTEKQLDMADFRIKQIEKLTENLHAENFMDLMYISELCERLTVCRILIAHLKARKETRWHVFAENLDYPEKDDKNFMKYVNSRLENGEIKVFLRELIGESESI